MLETFRRSASGFLDTTDLSIFEISRDKVPVVFLLPTTVNGDPMLSNKGNGKYVIGTPKYLHSSEGKEQ